MENMAPAFLAHLGHVLDERIGAVVAIGRVVGTVITEVADVVGAAGSVVMMHEYI